MSVINETINLLYLIILQEKKTKIIRIIKTEIFHEIFINNWYQWYE